MAVTGQPDPLRYDEDAIAAAVRELPHPRQVSFACACAERLMPTYRWYCSRTGQGDFAVLREALDKSWSGGRQGELDLLAAVARLRDRIEALLPPDGGEADMPGAAVAQNAVACVIYALRTWETADPQEAVWSARQLYDAADVVVQQIAPAQTYVEDIDLEPPVQLMLQGIHAALQDAPPVEELIAEADADGRRFLRFLEGSD